MHQESQQAGGKRSTIALQAARVSFVLGLLLFLFLKERPSQSGAAGAPHTHFPLHWGHKVCTGQRQSLRSPGSVPRSHPSQAEHPQARGDLRSRRCRSSPFPPTLLLSNGSAAVREPGARLQAAAEQHGEASAVFLVFLRLEGPWSRFKLLLGGHPRLLTGSARLQARRLCWGSRRG